MTIDDTTPAGNGKNSKGSRRIGVDRDDTRSSSKGTLVDRLLGGEPYALAFGGQGAPWLSSLEELSRDNGLEPALTTIVNDAADHWPPWRRNSSSCARSDSTPSPGSSSRNSPTKRTAPRPAGPSAAALTSAAVSLPGVFLTQIAALRALAAQGLDPAVTAPVSVIGHSQGLLAAEAVDSWVSRTANSSPSLSSSVRLPASSAVVAE